jgi:signal transduction histidine kinase
VRTIHDADDGSAAAHSRGAQARRAEELEMVLGLARIGYCVLSIDREIVRANSQFKAELGFAPDIALSWSDIDARVHEDDRGAFGASVQRALTGNSALEMLVRTAWNGSVPRWLALRGECLTSENAQRQLLLVTWDATPGQLVAGALRGDLERERHARNAAEQANQAKDEFLSLVSHELRSPLNAIVGWNRILAVKRADDEEVLAVTRRIEQSSRAQVKLMNDLSDLARIATGRLQILPRSVRMPAIVSAAVDAARASAEAGRIELRLDCGPGRMELMADPERLQQVVTNLLSNAIKFTPAGGVIEVRLTASDWLVELTVTDTGQGIAPDLLPHVFDRFRPSAQSGPRRTSGLGLGLTVVREIVALHGGTISASSEGVGHGATFRVRLPLTQAKSHAELQTESRSAEQGANGHHSTGNGSEARVPQRQLDGLSILVVDDEFDARTVLAEHLRLEGARVAVSDSAEAALERLTAQNCAFDAVLTDIGMPGEDGYSLVRKLRQLECGAHMLAIAVTGHTARADVEAALDAGFDLHVPKPVDFASFVPIIRRLSAPR